MNTFQNLDFQGGGANPSGIKPIAYAALKSEIDEFPEMADVIATSAEASGYKADSDFKLVKDAVFRTIYSTQGVGKAETTTEGEADCQCFTNKVTLKYPDLDDAGKAYLNASLNTSMVVIVPHYTKAGVRYAVIGGRDFDAKVTNKGNTGDKAGSAKGIDIEISASDYWALPNYNGVIVTDKGSLNCATGVFTPKGAPEVPPVEA